MLQIPDGAKARLIDELNKTPMPTEDEYLQMQADGFNKSVGKAQSENDRYFYSVDCPICKNKYYVRKVRDGVLVDQQCACVEKRKAILRAERSGMADLLDKRLSTFETKSDWQMNMKRKATEFVKNPVGWFGVFGQSGTGKTHICAAICNNLLAQGKKAAYLRWVDFAAKMERVRFDDYKRSAEMDKYADAEVLYIDDLLKLARLDKQNELALALELISRRAAKRGGITIISGEIVPRELAQIDEAIAGRLIEYCRENLIVLPKDSSKNYRLGGGV